jgi:hypothetical protein
VGIRVAPPATISTTIVSPMALDIPRMIAVLIPEREEGRRTRQIVCQGVAPSAREASRISRETEWMASSERLVIVGIDIMARIIEALKRFSPTGALK